MMNMNKTLLTTIVLGLSLSTGAEASLVARSGGIVYDTVNNISWAADANLFKTQSAGNANLVSQIITANGGVIHDTPNIYDNGTYTLTSSDFNATTGAMTWWGAQAWANNLTLGGVKGWSLPRTPVEAYGAITSSQMGDLFYTQLGGAAWTDIATTHNVNYKLFANVKSGVYWSGSEVSYYSDSAWSFYTFLGYQNDDRYKDNQFYAWAVRPGDVAAVPVSGAFWLFGSGLVALTGLKRRGSIG